MSRRKRTMLSAVNSQWDAFSPEAAGAKQFDSNAALTNTWRSVDVFTVTTDSNGAAAFQVSCVPGARFRQATTITSDVVSTDASWTASAGNSYATAHEAFRVVSFGVRFKTICNANVAAGTMRVNSVHTPQSLAAFTDFASDCTFYPIQHGFKAKWYAKPRGEHIHDFLDGAAQISDLTASGAVQGLPTTNLDVFISGATASTGVLLVETVVNYELLPIESDVNTSQSAGRSWPHVQKIIDTVSNVARDHPHVVEGVAGAGAVGTLIGGAETGAGMYAGTELASAAASSSIWDSIGGALLGAAEDLPLLLAL
jgi:hypothetical protein